MTITSRKTPNTESVDKFISDWTSNSQPTKIKVRTTRVHRNFEVEISPSARRDTVRLNSIRSLNPKCGELKKLLNWLAKKADKHGVTLTMACQPFGFGWSGDEFPDKDKLKDIAERYKFVVKFEYPDGDGYEMVREPN